MPKFTELKQYIEKELQSKKFLTEAADFLEQLSSVENELAELQTRLAADRKGEEALGKRIEAKQRELDELNELLRDRAEKAETIIDNAKDKGKAIVAQAEQEAKEIIETTHADLEKVKAEVAAKLEQRDIVDAEIAEKTETRDKLLAEIEKLRKKFEKE